MSLSVKVRYLMVAGANFGAGLLGFASVALISRHFGAGAVGDVGLATAILSYALIIATGGTDLFAIRKVASAPLTLGRMAADVLAVRLGLGVVCFGLMLGLGAVLYPDRMVLLALFATTLFSAAVTTLWIPQALHRSGVYALGNVMTQVIWLALLWLSLKSGYGILAVPVTKLCAELLIAAALLAWLYGLGHRLPAPSAPGALFRLAADCLPIAGTQLVRGLSLGFDLAVLAYFVTREETGHFAVCFKLFGFMLGLGTAYFTILLPRIAQQPTPAGMRHELHASFRQTLPAAILAAAGLVVFAQPILELLFGAPFGQAANCLRLLCLAWLANIVGRHYRQVLLARDRQATDFRLSVGGAVVHVLARVAFIPLWGIEGAALGMVLGELFLCLGQLKVAYAALSDPPPATVPADPVVLSPSK